MGRYIKLKSLLVFIVILSLKIISQMESQNDKDFFKMLVKKRSFKKIRGNKFRFFMAQIALPLLFK